MYYTKVKKESFIEVVIFKVGIKSQVIHQLDGAPKNRKKGKLGGRKHSFHKERTSRV